MDTKNKYTEVCPHCGKETAVDASRFAVDASRLGRADWMLCGNCNKHIFYKHYPCGTQIQFYPRHVRAQYFGYCPCCDEDVYKAECEPVYSFEAFRALCRDR